MTHIRSVTDPAESPRRMSRGNAMLQSGQCNLFLPGEHIVVDIDNRLPPFLFPLRQITGERLGPPFVYLSRRRGLSKRLGFLRRAHRRLLRNRRCVPFRKDDRRLSRKFTPSRVVSACAVSQNAHFLQFSREKKAREGERGRERK